MDAKQFNAFIVQQEQITELLRILVSQREQSLPSTSKQDTDNKTSGTSKILSNFTNDKFNPETTPVNEFIDYFEAKCNILGKECKKIQKDIFITCLSPNVFHKIKTSFMDSFENRTYEDLKAKLYSFYSSKKTRYKALLEFWSCIRQEGETMEVYANKIKTLSKDCGYEGQLLERQLRDRFATGLNHETLEIDLKQKWPELQDRDSKGNIIEITFEQIFAISQSRELAENDNINNGATIQRVKHTNANATTTNDSQLRVLTKNQCKRCGNPDKHDITDCRAKNHSCKACNIKGHFESCCLKTGKAYISFRRGTSRADNHKKVNNVLANNRNISGRNRYVTSSSSDEDSGAEANVYKVKTTTSRCKKIDARINGQKCTMDWDPGSIYSIISTAFWKKIGSPEMTTGPKLRAYGNHKLKPKGLTDVTIEVQGEQKILPVVVINNANPMLFGLHWSEMFNMTFPKSVYSIKGQTLSLKQIINENKELFNEKLGEVKDYEVNIHIKTGMEPKHLQPRPIKFSIRKNVEIELERLSKDGIIEKIDPNVTPIEWATPTVNVVKPNGQIRICGDYRITINPALLTHRHPVPQFDHLRQRLSNGEKYSKIDLKDAYLQFKVAPASKKYLTIVTHKGYYQYNRMPFGITTAPAIFQHYLEELLKDIPNIAIYFDDIAVTGKNNAEHLQTLAEVMNRLKKSGMKVNLKKCMFLQDDIEYLGHTINKHGVRPTTSKIDAILNATPPENVRELRSFLGLVNFYERFIPHLHSTCAELHALTGHRQKWKWTEHENKVFEKTKRYIAKSKPLIAFDEKLPLFLACDASEKGVGAVLYHKIDNIDKPIAFASRKLKQAESNYSVIDREALAIFFGVTKFDQFLRGSEFTLVTDHKPLIHLLGTNRNLPKLVNNRLIRWALIIGSYNYNIQYTKGKNNILADPLSRLPNPHELQSPEERSVNKIVQTIRQSMINEVAINEDTIKEQTKSDMILRKVTQCIKTNWSSFKCDDQILQAYFKKRNELSVENDIIMWQGRIVIPTSMRKITLKYLHRGHPGISAMKALARFYIWWPTVDEEIENYVKACTGCQENRPNNPELPIFSWSIPNNVWERIHIDFAGPFLGKYWLVLCDALSKWIEVKPMNKTTSDKLCIELDNIFTTFGLPQIIVSDNGPQLTSELFKTYCKKRGITHITSAPYHPRTNGLAERLVRTFKTRMASELNRNIDLTERLRNFLFTYRNTPHNTTGKSPAQMMFGRQLNCLLDNARPSTKKRLHHKIVKANILTERSCPNYQPGRKIYVRTKEESKWKPAVIEKRTHRYSYVIRTPEGLKRRHADQIRVNDASPQSTPFQTPDAPDTPDTPPTVELQQTPTTTTAPTIRRSTRLIRAPRRLIEEM